MVSDEGRCICCIPRRVMNGRRNQRVVWWGGDLYPAIRFYGKMGLPQFVLIRLVLNDRLNK